MTLFTFIQKVPVPNDKQLCGFSISLFMKILNAIIGMQLSEPLIAQLAKNAEPKYHNNKRIIHKPGQSRL